MASAIRRRRPMRSGLRQIVCLASGKGRPTGRPSGLVSERAATIGGREVLRAGNYCRQATESGRGGRPAAATASVFRLLIATAAISRLRVMSVSRSRLHRSESRALRRLSIAVTSRRIAVWSAAAASIIGQLLVRPVAASSQTGLTSGRVAAMG